jgi:hypothetical protein
MHLMIKEEVNSETREQENGKEREERGPAAEKKRAGEGFNATA